MAHKDVPRYHAEPGKREDGTDRIRLVRDDVKGKFCEFKYVLRAQQENARLTAKNHKLLRELQEQREINETRLLLEVAIMEQAAGMVKKALE